MIRIESVLVVAVATCISCATRSNSVANVVTAEEIRADALATAKREEKVAMLIFIMPGESWSERLDKYHADPEVSQVIGRHFVFAKVDIEETFGGEQMYLEYGGMRGVPAFSVLDSEGMLLAHSGDMEQNVGFPNDAEQVDRYVAAIRTACPKLSDEEVEVLRGKLDELRLAQ